MKYCGKCHVYIENPRSMCPLCQNQLSTQDSEAELQESFPLVKTTYQKYRFLLRLLLFISVAGSISGLAINSFFTQGGWWSLILIAAFIYFWVAVLNLIQTRNSLGGIARSTFFLSFVLILIDYLYSFMRWSINYAIPALFLASILAVIVLSVIRGKSLADFALYMLIVSAFALIPFLFILARLATVTWPSFICSFSGVLSLLGVFIIADKETLDEIKRRFHF